MYVFKNDKNVREVPLKNSTRSFLSTSYAASKPAISDGQKEKMVSCSISEKYGLLRQTKLLGKKPAVLHCLYFIRRPRAHKCT